MQSDPNELIRLAERARRVLQQHVQFGFVPALYHDDGVYPHFAQHGSGSRLVDVAGVEYVDWFMGGGPLLLGHRHPAVEAAIREQLDRGSHMSLPCPIEVDVAESVVECVPSIEQIVIAKNGTDVTSAAVRLARAITGRDRILMCGYHGFQDWSIAANPHVAGIPDAMRGLVHAFDYGEIERAKELLTQHGSEVAAIFVEPVRRGELLPEFLAEMRALADEYGCLLVFDEIVTGFRVARGGAQEAAGVMPDLTCLAKALANGSPLAVLGGPMRHIRHMPRLHFGMTYRRDALSLAAARAALGIYREGGVPPQVSTIGSALQSEFRRAAEAEQLDWELAGHPAMPEIRVHGGGRLTDVGAMLLFVEVCQRRGVYLQPHRLYVSAAHTDEDVRRTVPVLAEAMAVVRKAMDEGLERYLDSPIQARHCVGGRVSPDATHGSDAADCPFEGVPEPLRGRMRLFREPDDERVAAEVLGSEVRLRFASCAAGEQVAAGIAFGVPIDVPFRVRVGYRILEWEPRNAIVNFGLVAHRPDARFGCQHATNIGRHTYAKSFGPGGSTEVQCAYGLRDATLCLERTAQEFVMTFDDGNEAEELARYDAVAGNLRLRFRVGIDGASGPVTVAVTSFELGLLG